MKFESFTAWDQLPESADLLFEKAERDSIFYSRPWFENLASSLDDQQLFIACVIEENKVLAILPMIQNNDDSLLPLKHRYTTHFSLLITDDDQAQIITCLVQGLDQLSISSLLLEPVADDDSSLINLQRGMQAGSYNCELNFRFYNWIYRVNGQSFENYMATRPAKLRNTIARKKRKLDREHGHVIKLYSGETVPQAMSDYYAAYNASWKANEQYVDFLDAVVRKFSIRGWSRLAVLYVDEQAIAAQLWFVAHNKASIFRLAYDESWKAYSPGSILTGFLMQYVIDTDRVDEIDFLTGNDAYKRDWMSERRQRYALSCVKHAGSSSKYSKLANLLKRNLKKPL